MNPFKSNLLAWSVATAALALWATSAPISWGQVAAGSARLFDQSADDSANTTSVNIQLGDATGVTTDNGAQNTQCPTVPADIAQLIPPIPTLAPVPAAQSDSAPAAQAGSFHICGPDSQAERAIELLIAGRSFSSTLSSRGDGCADLSIRVGQQVTSGSSSSNVSVSLGSGRTLSIKIVSEPGATRATIASQ